jgi:hypothetical protein
MSRHIQALRIISAYFFSSGILTGIFLFRAKTASTLYLTYTAVYVVSMVGIAVGLFKLFPWARYAAIVALSAKTVQFEVGAIHDIRTMNMHAVDMTSILVSVLLIVPITALYASAIWWLSRTSTKEIFIHTRT